MPGPTPLLNYSYPVVLYDVSGNALSLGGTPVLMADATANPTIPQQAAFDMLYTSAAWERARTMGAVQATGANTGAQAVGLVLNDPTGGGIYAALMSAASDAMLIRGPLAAGGMGFTGATWDRLRTPNVFKTVTAQAVAAGTGISIWTPAAGKKVRLMGYVFSASAAASLKFYTGAVGALTTLIFQGPLLAAAGIDNQGGGGIGNGILAATADHRLNLDVSANATVSGTVWGTEE